ADAPFLSEAVSATPRGDTATDCGLAGTAGGGEALACPRGLDRAGLRCHTGRERRRLSPPNRPEYLVVRESGMAYNPAQMTDATRILMDAERGDPRAAP